MNYISSRGEVFDLPPVSHPWLRGDGIFETLKTEDGKVFFLRRHMARAIASASKLHFKKMPSPKIESDINSLLERTHFERGRLRVTIFPDGEYLISHEEAPLRNMPHKILVSPVKKYSQSMLSGIKSLSYGESAAGMRLASASNCDDLLYFNERNEVVEFGLANILVEKNGIFHTPPLKSGALAGIVREVLLEWFGNIRESTMLSEAIRDADGIYLISSLREIVLVSEVHWQNGEVNRYRFSAEAEKLRTQYLINSRSNPNS